MLCRATQDRRVTVKSSDKTQSTGGGNSKPLQYSCRENPMNSVRQKNMTPEDEHHNQKVSNMLLGKSGGQSLLVPEGMQWLGQSGYDAQLCGCG